MNGNKIKPINENILRDCKGFIVRCLDGDVIATQLAAWEIILECEQWLDPENRHVMKELRIMAKALRKGVCFRKFVSDKLELKWFESKLVRLVIKWMHIRVLLVKNGLFDEIYIEKSEYVRQLFKIMGHLFNVDAINFAAKIGCCKDAYSQLDQSDMDGAHLGNIIEIGQTMYAKQEPMMREERRQDRQDDLHAHNTRVQAHRDAGNLTPYDDSHSSDYAVFKSATPTHSPFYTTTAEFSDSNRKEERNYE